MNWTFRWIAVPVALGLMISSGFSQEQDAVKKRMGDELGAFLSGLFEKDLKPEYHALRVQYLKGPVDPLLENQTAISPLRKSANYTKVFSLAKEVLNNPSNKIAKEAFLHAMIGISRIEHIGTDTFDMNVVSTSAGPSPEYGQTVVTLDLNGQTLHLKFLIRILLKNILALHPSPEELIAATHSVLFHEYFHAIVMTELARDAFGRFNFELEPTGKGTFQLHSKIPGDFNSHKAEKTANIFRQFWTNAGLISLHEYFAHLVTLRRLNVFGLPFSHPRLRLMTLENIAAMVFMNAHQFFLENQRLTGNDTESIFAILYEGRNFATVSQSMDSKEIQSVAKKVVGFMYEHWTKEYFK